MKAVFILPSDCASLQSTCTPTVVRPPALRNPGKYVCVCGGGICHAVQSFTHIHSFYAKVGLIISSLDRWFQPDIQRTIPSNLVSFGEYLSPAGDQETT